MYKRIMVPLDGSPFGEQAIPFAASIARRSGGKLILLYSLDLLMPPPRTWPHLSWWEEGGQQPARDYIKAAVARVREAANVPVTGRIVTGRAATRILEEAELGADLIVMCTHARSPVRRAWLGSVADEVLRRTTVPLLLVRPAEAERLGLAEDWRIHDVLVPLDGSYEAEQILRPACELAQSFGAFTTLLRVTQPWSMAVTPLQYAAACAVDSADIGIAQLQDAASQYLEDTGLIWAPPHYRVQTDSIIGTGGSAAMDILSYAESRGTDLIAMTTHGDSGITRLLLGSVADKVIRASHIPVLVLWNRDVPA